MAFDTPWQILDQSRLNIPGLMQAAGEAKTRRLHEMMLNRQMEREDREADREDKLLGIYAKLKQPGSQPKGGGPASGGVGGGEVTPPRPSNIPSGSPAAPAQPAGQMGGVGSPEAQQAPPEVVQSWVDANREVVGELLTIDPGKAFALTQQLANLDDVSRARVKEMNELRGRVALTLANVPQAQRGQALASLMPRLREMGITPDVVRQELGDLSDMSLQMAASLSQDVATLSKAQEEYTLQPGAARYRGSELVAERPFAPKTLTVGEGQTVVEYQPGGGGGTGGAVNPAQFDEIAASVVPGIVKTSGMRSPEKNAAVGGVANSYHLTGEASDYVPPKGMTMDALAQTLRQAMPGAQVINEGDHVHVEPASRQQGGSRVIAQGASKQEKAPAGYRWTPQGTLAPIKGGPADKKGGGGASTKDVVALRKQFDALPEVKAFKDVRAGYQQVKSLGMKKDATAQDDIAMIFSFMKILDPGSVVREGEFATAQNASGIPDVVRNQWNRALNGERLNPNQRREMVKTARTMYQQREAQYNEAAGQYQGYARDLGIEPTTIARRFVPPKTAQNSIARVKNDADYNKLPSGAMFIAPDGTRRKKP